jgi:hypothetical protein
VSAPALDDVLAEVNRLRAECDLQPLDAMPKQDPTRGQGWSTTCPMTVALDAWSSAPNYFRRGENDRHGNYRLAYGSDPLPLPEVCALFIRHFDSGKYPELEA